MSINRTPFRFGLIALLAAMTVGCSSSPKLGLDSQPPKEGEEIDLDSEARRVREMQKIRVRYEYPSGDSLDIESLGTAEETVMWAAYVCGGSDAAFRYVFGHAEHATIPELSATGMTELRLCIARGYMRMAETARGPITVVLDGGTEVIIPVQSGAARITLAARATEYARLTWDMADGDLNEYIEDDGFYSNEDQQPGMSLDATTAYIDGTEATEQAALLGPVMREAYDRYLEYHETLINQVVAVADAELASSTTASLSAFRGVSRDILSRSWAAHLIVGGELGLTGIDEGRLCNAPKLTPQAERAIEIFRRAAPKPADLVGTMGIGELLNSSSMSVGSVRRRLQQLFDEDIPNSVEERYQLRTEDFVEAREYLKDELRVFARSLDREIPGQASDPFVRYAALANPPSTSNPPYWAALARLGTINGNVTTVLGPALRHFQKTAAVLQANATSVDSSIRPAIFGPLASVSSDLDEQVLGDFSNAAGSVLMTLRGEVRSRLTKLRIAIGEEGLECATKGVIEGVPCTTAELTARTRTSFQSIEGSDGEWFYNFPGPEVQGRVYVIYSPDGSEDPGHFRSLGGAGSGGNFVLAPSLDERAAVIIEPNEKWCTHPKVGCAEGTEGSNAFTFDERVPLENELADDGDAVESSWRYYLNRAKEAAAEADSLGEAYILANLENDNRKETVEMRAEARRAEAEAALAALQTTCGTNVDPAALLTLLTGGDPNQPADLSGMRKDIVCDSDTDCNDSGRTGFECMAGSCILDIRTYLDGQRNLPDNDLTEGLHRLAECIGSDTESRFVSLGNTALCAYALDTPSQLCQVATGDKFYACPALAKGTSNCRKCTSATDTNCYQVPQGATNSRYQTYQIAGDDLLGYFDTELSKADTSPRNACNFLSDALRWDPDALVLNIPGVQTTNQVSEEVIDAWIRNIKATGMFHPDSNLTDVVSKIGLITNYSGTSDGAITYGGRTMFTPTNRGNLWWYTSDQVGFEALLALKLGLRSSIQNMSFPYYIAEKATPSQSAIITEEKFLSGGQAYKAFWSTGFDSKASKDRHKEPEEVCDDGAPGEATGCVTLYGFPEANWVVVRTDGLSPEQYVGYGTLPGRTPIVGNPAYFMNLAIGSWPGGSSSLASPANRWWFNGFSTATPESAGNAKCGEGTCNDLFKYALLEDRNLVLSTPFRTYAYGLGEDTFWAPAGTAATTITTTDLLRGAQLACEIVDFDNSFRCDPANPPTVNGVQDLQNVRKAMECAAQQIEGRAGLALYAHFPNRARNALRQQSIVGAFPAVGGDLGKMTSDLSGGLVAIKQTVSDIGVEANLIGNALDRLRTAEGLQDVRDKIVDVNFQQSVTSLVSGCLRDVASNIGVNLVVNPGGAAAAAVTCAAAVVQADLAGKLQTLQHEENQLIYLDALNSVRENLTTRAGNMQRLKSQLLEQMSGLEGQLAAIESLRYEARRQLSRALYKASSQAETEPALTNVYANRANVSQLRYKRAHERAVKLAFLARRAIETRLGVDLSTLGEEYPLVEAPATWASTLCNTTGVDYDKLRQDSAEFGETASEDFADQFIGTYVQKLSDFVEAYRLQHAFKEGQDTVVASLRDDILGVKSECRTLSRNQLLGTQDLATRWASTGCVNDIDCVRATKMLGTEADATDYDPKDAELSAAPPIAVHLGSSQGACVAPACGYAAGAGLIQEIQPRETLYPQKYVLSWYYPATYMGGEALFEALDAETSAPLAGVTSGTMPTSRVTGWKRSYLRFTLNAEKRVAIRIGASVNATSTGKHFYIAAPMLEAAFGKDPLPTAFQGSDDEGMRVDKTCPDAGGTTFRVENWKRECIKLCGDGFAASCAEEVATTACYREVSFSLSQRDIELGRLLAASGFAQGNYNYRIENIGVNLVGTSINDCADSQAPETCYASANVQYSLIHSGPYIVRNHMGEDYQAQLFTGQIEHARALASERYITNPMSSTDKDLLSSFQRNEFAGRTLDGRYALRIWESPALDFDSIEDVQLVLNYRYWTRTN